MALRLLKSADAGERLSIVHLNAYDYHGGAERIVCDLIELQRAAGYCSIALVGHKTRADSGAIAFEIDPDLARREEFRRAGLPDYEFRGSHRLVRNAAVQQANVIHAHNLYGSYFHPFSLIALSHFRPVVWSINDMQALTGYCSHALDCTRWENGCGECPDLTRPGPRLAFDNTAALWRDKKIVSENSRVWVVGASTWIVSQLQRSLLKHHPICHIPNGIDTRVFRLTDRAEARRKLRLPSGALIVGSLARSGVLAHPWKGGDYVRATLKALRLDDPEMLFLNIGSTETAPEPWIRSIAPPSTESLREALNALDFFLYPSIADTAPLSVLEAMACGLPVVGFQVGGMPDLVTAAEGFLVPTGDTQALIEVARKMAADPQLRQRLGRAARDRTVSHFDHSYMATAYEQLYHEAARAHAGDGARKTAGFDFNAISASLEEMRLLQGKMIGLEAKLSELRARRDEEDTQIATLLRNRWLRFGIWLAIVRGPVKNWLRRKHRQLAKKVERGRHR